MEKQVKHKYAVGDIVGIVSGCMADCEILECLPGKSYVATAVKIHLPHPEDSFFGKNPKFTVFEKQIGNRNRLRKSLSTIVSAAMWLFEEE